MHQKAQGPPTIPPLYSAEHDGRSLLQQESLYHLANGRLGLRGNLTERRENTYPPDISGVRGSYLNGFYEEIPYHYPEALAAFPMKGERLVNLPDARSLEIEVDGAILDPCGVHVRDWRRELNMEEGYSLRTYRWQGSLAFSCEEFIPFSGEALFLQRIHLRNTSEEELHLRLSYGIDGGVCNNSKEGDPRVGNGETQFLDILESGVHGEEGQKILEMKACTRRSGLLLAIALSQHWQIQGPADEERFEATISSEQMPSADLGVAEGKTSLRKSPLHIEEERHICLKPGESLQGLRYLAYEDSRHAADPAAAARQIVREAEKKGFEQIKKEQKQFCACFWQQSRVFVEGDAESQLALDFSLFNLLQSAPSDGQTLIPAKGLSGEGYEGHYFWDFEIYMLPFYLWTWPERGRSLLDYRYAILEQARKNARLLGYSRGAQYAWRSISGAECSAYFPSGSAQLHINADIALAFDLYCRLTGDRDYLRDKAAEVLLETARTWLDCGCWKNDRFMIFGVTGPDEYSCLVNNNYYTNLSAQANLRAALRAVETLRHFGELDELWFKLKLSEEELREMEAAANTMYLPYDEELGIDAQDDAFLSLKPWDLAATDPSLFPLLLHFHPSKLYRYQLLKQPDTSLAHFLYAENPESEVVKRSTVYYEALTSHDSSLSPCIYGAMAALNGEREKAMTYFRMSRDIDLKDRQGNSVDGLHMGNLGGTWRFAVEGFAGLRLPPPNRPASGNTEMEEPSFKPQLPKEWKRLRFPFTFQGRKYLAEFSREDKKIRARYKALIFDLDGVIFHSDELHYRAWKQIAAQEKLPFSREDNHLMRGVGRLESLDLLLGAVSKTYSKEKKRSLAEQKNRYYQEEILRLTPQDMDALSLEALKNFKNAGYILALASASRNAKLLLSRLGLLSFFDSITDGCDGFPAKPQPTLFLEAAKKLSLDPEDCLVIEDAESGLEAAFRGGFDRVGVGPASDSPRASFHARNVAALSEILLPNWFRN